MQHGECAHQSHGEVRRDQPDADPLADRLDGIVHSVMALNWPFATHSYEIACDPCLSLANNQLSEHTVTCLYSADRMTCVTGAPHSLQNLELGGSSVPHDPQCSPRRGQSTATIPAGVHVSIVSPLVNDVRHIAAPSPTRSFDPHMSSISRGTARIGLAPVGRVRKTASRSFSIRRRTVAAASRVFVRRSRSARLLTPPRPEQLPRRRVVGLAVRCAGHLVHDADLPRKLVAGEVAPGHRRGCPRSKHCGRG